MADLTITITIPDAARQDFLDAYCERYGYTDALGLTRPQFARGIARDMVRAPLRMWRQEKAERAAFAAVTVADDGISAA